MCYHGPEATVTEKGTTIKSATTASTSTVSYSPALHDGDYAKKNSGLKYVLKNGTLFINDKGVQSPSGDFYTIGLVMSAINEGRLVRIGQPNVQQVPAAKATEGFYLKEGGRLIYKLEKGSITYADRAWTTTEFIPSGDFRSITSFADAIQTGKLQKLPIALPGQDLEGSLKRAQSATGFTLNDVVKVIDSGEIGEIVGFGRVNLEGGERGERVVLIQFSSNEDEADIRAISSSQLDLVVSASNRQLQTA